MSQLLQDQTLDFHNPLFPNRTCLTQRGPIDMRLRLQSVSFRQVDWRFRGEANVTGVITPVGVGRAAFSSSSGSVFSAVVAKH